MKTLIPLFMVVLLTGCETMYANHGQQSYRPAYGGTAVYVPMPMYGAPMMRNHGVNSNPYIQPTNQITCVQSGVFTNCF